MVDMMTVDTVLETPSGRKIGIRKLDPSEWMDVIEAADSASSNSTWLNYALAMCSVRTVDGHPVLMPKTKVDVRALADRLGMDGMNAVTRYVWTVDKPQDGAAPTAEPAADQATDKIVETAKN